MKLICGLGNPGKEYRNTRHNVGFMAVDYYSQELNIKLTENKKFQSYIYKDKEIILLKPMTYMNNSGLAIKKVVDFYDIEKKDIIIIYDDLDMEYGKIRIRIKGSSGGHNGIKSIINHLGTETFTRIKIGIEKNINKDTVSHVLGKFSKTQLDSINSSIMDVEKIINDFVNEKDIKDIMNKFN